MNHSVMTSNVNLNSTRNVPRAAIATLLAFIAIALVPAFIGNAFPPDAWFVEWAKPSWNPPSWIFGPVWTVLYTLIGYLGYLACRSTLSIQRYGAFSVYAIQLALNGLWTPLFFGYHGLGLALITIVAFWVAIRLNIVAFYRIKPASGLLLIPYLLWASCATLLNAAIWNLDR